MEIKDPNRSGSDPAEDQPTLNGIPSPAPAGLAARYDIPGEVGRGGMGIVYEVRDRETGAIVALEVLGPRRLWTELSAGGMSSKYCQG